MDTKFHYENHLAKYYSWIYGGFEEKAKQNLEFFNKNNIKPKSTGIALDLGAGSGFQSIPLAELGFKVTSIDFSKSLLEELKLRSSGFTINIVENDILNFDSYKNLSPELIVCMGDTITHLETSNSVYDFLNNCYSILSRDGVLILSFRELISELENEKRFIPVASSKDKIFTCFLEYYPEYVKVFDIVHEKVDEKWAQKISFYKKLRISSEDIIKHLESIGFSIDKCDLANGFTGIVCCKRQIMCMNDFKNYQSC